MNARQKIHQLHIQQWTTRFQEQASSGLTVREWCAKNNFSIHTYNYWKHLIKQNYVDSVIPDIVPLSVNALTATGQSDFAPPSLPSMAPQGLVPDSRNSLDSPDMGSICISLGAFHISVDSSASEEFILRILKAVQHA